MPKTNLKILGFIKRECNNEFLFKTKRIKKELLDKMKYFYGPYEYKNQTSRCHHFQDQELKNSSKKIKRYKCMIFQPFSRLFKFQKKPKSICRDFKIIQDQLITMKHEVKTQSHSISIKPVNVTIEPLTEEKHPEVVEDQEKSKPKEADPPTSNEVDKPKSKTSLFTSKARQSLQIDNKENKDEKLGISLSMLLDVLRSRGKTEYKSKDKIRSTKKLPANCNSSINSVTVNSKDSSNSSKKSQRLIESKLEERDLEDSSKNTNEDIRINKLSNTMYSKHKNSSNITFRNFNKDPFEITNKENHKERFLSASSCSNSEAENQLLNL